MSKTDTNTAPRQLTSLQIDGGATLRCTVPVGEVSERFLALTGARGKLRSISMPDGSTRYAEIRGERTRVIDFAGDAQIKFKRGGGTAQIEVCLRAVALLADGYRATAERWIGAVSWWLFGERVGLETARAHGWEVRQLPIAVDFHDLPIRGSDASSFAGVRKTSVTFDRGDARTLYVGSKKSPVRWVLYLKSVEILERRGGDRSAYAAHWSRSLHYDPSAEVTRAELRLQGDGLCFVDSDTGEVFDLRDPAALADEAALGAVWASAAQRRRLVIGGRTRNRRAVMDPRWGAVLAAAKCEPRRLRQARELRAAACEVTQLARRTRALRALHRSAASDGLGLPGSREVGEYAAALAELDPDANMDAATRGIKDYCRNRERWGDGPRRAAVMLRDRGLLPAGAWTVPLTAVALADALESPTSAPVQSLPRALEPPTSAPVESRPQAPVSSPPMASGRRPHRERQHERQDHEQGPPTGPPTRQPTRPHY